MEVEGICCRGKIRKQSAAGAPEDKLEMESNGSCDSVSFIVTLLILPATPSPGSLGSLLISWYGSHWCLQPIWSFKPGFPWLTDISVFVNSTEHVAQPRPWMIPAVTQVLRCTAFSGGPGVNGEWNVTEWIRHGLCLCISFHEDNAHKNANFYFNVQRTSL